ncbi:ribosomal-protein-alanine acetyltransferase [Serratia ficaria]|uniref:bifunctional helix-turn-helix transcriptional regulator/GNAT family N-acetyltransferase n=1 Tax=Serratia ficaria TaxID=61651 RepID=UPI00217B1661|nr:bifunctional helix-turn-helix transcriptional regulator/GNAT family N-acetyltransferase [Serratia ficaria]CAI1671316.1 ribosomal-protein-alanine acetyltransferase [Serratia ficaria]
MPDAYLLPIRDASRRLVRELGFMGNTLAGTDLPPSAVHALIEIGEGRANHAAALCGALNLEKSSVSRMLNKLRKAGLLDVQPSERDGREKLLALSEQGRETLAAINHFADRQVRGALNTRHGDGAAIVSGLQAYVAALRASRTGEAQVRAAVEIVSGYRPGWVARTLEMHMQYYSRSVGFGVFFEAKVGAMLADLAGRLFHPQNQAWSAIGDGRILGSISVDGESLGNNRAHLRAFILDDALRGSGIGRQLLGKAVEFCDQRRFDEIHLWTFKGLDAARHLYESAGFKLADEQPGTAWGRQMVEQLFVRRRLSPAA